MKSHSRRIYDQRILQCEPIKFPNLHCEMHTGKTKKKQNVDAWNVDDELAYV